MFPHIFDVILLYFSSQKAFRLVSGWYTDIVNATEVWTSSKSGFSHACLFLYWKTNAFFQTTFWIFCWRFLLFQISAEADFLIKNPCRKSLSRKAHLLFTDFFRTPNFQAAKKKLSLNNQSPRPEPETEGGVSIRCAILGSSIRCYVKS